MLLLDVTDLVEFLQRRESVSGVQRVIAETAPLMLGDNAPAPAAAVILDRPRGVFVALTAAETQALVLTGAASHNPAPDREAIAAAASTALDRAHTANPIEINAETVMVYLGAVWINDALMLAARDVAAKGAKSVYLLYDLTPVLETGHTAAVNRLFERYLTLVLQTASAVPSISQSSKNDFDFYAKNHGYQTIRGEITALPCGLKPGKYDTSESPWPRDYALFVGTVESRKNHILALNAWKKLITKHGAENVPDLVCVGRLGWNADAFLEEYVATQGLSGKVSVLSNSVTDEELARFYANAQFTIYPSRYEGWGLPVSESLAFGKVAIVANNSSLPEAGGKLATYFESGNVDDLVTKIESDGLNAKNRESLEKKISAEFHDINWQQVTDAIMRDITYALSTESRKPMYPSIELGREYVLAVGGQAPDAGYADQYLDHLQREGLTPMLRQPRGADDFEVVDAAVIGTFGSPQVWGNEIRPGRRAERRGCHAVRQHVRGL